MRRRSANRRHASGSPGGARSAADGLGLPIRINGLPFTTVQQEASGKLTSAHCLTDRGQGDVAGTSDSTTPGFAGIQQIPAEQQQGGPTYDTSGRTA